MSKMQEEVLSNLRACISSRKGGVSLKELNADYRELIGENVPFSKLGFRSLEELMSTVPAVSVDHRTGNVTAVPTDKNRHLLELIAKQKDKVKRHSNIFKPYKRQRSYSRTYEAPRRNYRKSGYVQQPYYQNYQTFNNTNYNYAPQHYDYGQQAHWHYPGYGKSQNDYSQKYQQYQQVPKYNNQPRERPTDPNNNNTHKDLRHCTDARSHKRRYVFEKENTEPHKRPTDPNNNNTHTDLRQCMNARREKSRYIFVTEYYQPRKRPTDPNNNDTHTDLRHYINARRYKRRSLYVKETISVKFRAKKCDWEFKFSRPFCLDQCMWSKPAFIHDHQVIGDDLMLETLGLEPRTLCDSGMTAKKALLGVREYGCSDRVVIAIGSVDVLMGVEGDELILDMQQLIQCVQSTGAHVCVCTVPPIPSIGRHRPTIDAIITFNRWVRFAAHGAQVIELHALFKDGPFVNYGMFTTLQKYTRGCMWPLQPWNSFAQAAILDQLEWDLNTDSW